MGGFFGIRILKSDFRPNLTKMRAYDKIGCFEGSGKATDMNVGHNTVFFCLCLIFRRYGHLEKINNLVKLGKMKST